MYPQQQQPRDNNAVYAERTMRTRQDMPLETFISRMIDAINRKFDKQGYLLMATSEKVQKQGDKLDGLADDHRELSEFSSHVQKMNETRIEDMETDVQKLQKRLRITYAAVFVLALIIALVGLLIFFGPY